MVDLFAESFAVDAEVDSREKEVLVESSGVDVLVDPPEILRTDLELTFLT